MTTAVKKGKTTKKSKVKRNYSFYYGVCAREELVSPLLYLFKFTKAHDVYVLVGYARPTDTIDVAQGYSKPYKPHFDSYYKIKLTKHDNMKLLIKAAFTSKRTEIKEDKKYGRQGWTWVNKKSKYFAYIDKNKNLTVRNVTKKVKASFKINYLVIAYILRKIVKKSLIDKVIKSAYLIQKEEIGDSIKPVSKWFNYVDKGIYPYTGLKDKVKKITY